MTKVILMGAVGGIYGLLRAIYRKWLVPDEEKNNEGLHCNCSIIPFC